MFYKSIGSLEAAVAVKTDGREKRPTVSLIQAVGTNSLSLKKLLRHVTVVLQLDNSVATIWNFVGSNMLHAALR